MPTRLNFVFLIETSFYFVEKRNKFKKIKNTIKWVIFEVVPISNRNLAAIRVSTIMKKSF
jgi:hypothetical protein